MGDTKVRCSVAKILVCAFLASVVLVTAASALEARSLKVLPGPVAITRPTNLSPTAACLLLHHNDTAAAYYDGFTTGDRIATFMNPAACASPQYPFERMGL